jgi:hypothetical protein
MEDEGIWNGSATKERRTNTTASTGKNEREYSTTVASRGRVAAASA